MNAMTGAVGNGEGMRWAERTEGRWTRRELSAKVGDLMARSGDNFVGDRIEVLFTSLSALDGVCTEPVLGAGLRWACCWPMAMSCTIACTVIVMIVRRRILLAAGSWLGVGTTSCPSG